METTIREKYGARGAIRVAAMLIAIGAEHVSFRTVTRSRSLVVPLSALHLGRDETHGRLPRQQRVQVSYDRGYLVYTIPADEWSTKQATEIGASLIRHQSKRIEVLIPS
jgi:hypothetical protein